MTDRPQREAKVQLHVALSVEEDEALDTARARHGLGRSAYVRWLLRHATGLAKADPKKTPAKADPKKQA